MLHAEAAAKLAMVFKQTDVVSTAEVLQLVSSAFVNISQESEIVTGKTKPLYLNMAEQLVSFIPAAKQMET